MRRLVTVVKEMRQGIKNVVAVADTVKDGIREAVHVNKGETKSESNSKAYENFEEERNLARMLAEAFQERNDASQRYEAIHEFMERFDVSDNDSYLLENYNFENVLDQLNGGGGSIMEMSISGEEGSAQASLKEGMAFLDALNRVAKIRKELSSSFDTSSSSSLMRTNNPEKGSGATRLAPASAIRIVENLASKQDDAFERLYHFLHSKLELSQASVAHVPTSSSASSSAVLSHSLGEGLMDEILLNPFVKRSIVVLRQVPAYYRHTLELIATSRRSEVTRKFLIALSSGYDGMAPIEMKAHDPVNYVGDMLAFVFRTMSVESELAKGLVVEGETEVSSSDNDFTEDDMGIMSASDVLNDTVSGLHRPLKSRISQVISSLARRHDGEDIDEGLVAMHGTGGMDEEASTARLRLASLYSICGLMIFYYSAMEKSARKVSRSSTNGNDDNRTSGQSNPLVQCLLECIQEGASAYAASLRVYCAMLESFSSQSRDSQATVAHSVITRLCDVRAASPGYGIECNISDETNRVLSLGYLYEMVIESALQSCSNLDDVSMMKTASNSVRKVEGNLGESNEILNKWDTILQEKEAAMVDDQILSDTHYVIDECGLGSIGNAIESMSAVYIEGMIASSHPGLSQDSLEKAIASFYASLKDPPIPTYQKIKDPILRKYARNKVAESVTSIYEKIYDLARSEKGGYDNISFLVHDVEAVKSLLSS